MYFLIPFCFYLILLFIPTLIRWNQECFSNYDLGIYSQALHHISWGQLNPWLSVREIRVFNDHVDPILVFLAPWVQGLHVFGIDPSLSTLWMESLFILFSALLIVWMVRRKHIHPQVGGLFCVFVFLGRGVVHAIGFPAHPTTWSFLPLLGLGIAVYLRSFRWLIVASVSLLLFREEYVFSLLVLGLALLAGRQSRKAGRAVISVAMAGGILIYFFRDYWLGPSMAYGEMIFEPWRRSLVETLKLRLFNVGVIRGWLEMLLPFVPLWVWQYQKSKTGPLLTNRNFRKFLHSQAFLILIFLLPLLAIRFLSGRWSHHYGIAVTACFLGMSFHKNLKEKIPTSVLIVSLSLVLLQLPTLGKYAGRAYRDHLSQCSRAGGRMEELKLARLKIRSMIQQYPLPVLAMGNLIPKLVDLSQLYHFGHPILSRSFQNSEALLYFEKKPSGDPWPLTHSDFIKLRDESYLQGAQPLLRGQYAEVWKIRISDPAIQPHPVPKGVGGDSHSRENGEEIDK